MREVTIEFKEHNGAAVTDLIDDTAEVVVLEALPVGDEFRYRYAVVTYRTPREHARPQAAAQERGGAQVVSLPSAVEHDGARSAVARASSYGPSVPTLDKHWKLA